jgi:hypothetical protein
MYPGGINCRPGIEDTGIDCVNRPDRNNSRLAAQIHETGFVQHGFASLRQPAASQTIGGGRQHRRQSATIHGKAGYRYE